MGLLGGLLKTGIHLATTPIDLLKDAATLGGELTDQSEPYTFKKARKLRDDFKDIEDGIDNL